MNVALNCREHSNLLWVGWDGMDWMGLSALKSTYTMPMIEFWEIFCLFGNAPFMNLLRLNIPT